MAVNYIKACWQQSMNLGNVDVVEKILPQCMENYKHNIELGVLKHITYTGIII